MIRTGRSEPCCTARGTQRVEELGVDGEELALVVGQVVLVVDGLDGADGLTGTTVDTLVGVDVQRALALIDAVDRALLDAGAVLDVHAGQANDVCHLALLTFLR